MLMSARVIELETRYLCSPRESSNFYNQSGKTLVMNGKNAVSYASEPTFEKKKKTHDFLKSANESITLSIL